MLSVSKSNTSTIKDSWRLFKSHDGAVPWCGKYAQCEIGGTMSVQSQIFHQLRSAASFLMLDSHWIRRALYNQSESRILFRINDTKQNPVF